MLKETETEETIVFVTFLSLVAFNWMGLGLMGPLWLPLCTFCNAKAERAAADG